MVWDVYDVQKGKPLKLWSPEVPRLWISA